MWGVGSLEFGVKRGAGLERVPGFQEEVCLRV